MIDVAFATCEAEPGLFGDDVPAARALAARGVRVTPLPCSRRDVRWTDYAAVVVRSTWDYHLRLPELRDWLDGLEAAGVHVEDPPQVLRWNADKRIPCSSRSCRGGAGRRVVARLHRCRAHARRAQVGRRR